MKFLKFSIIILFAAISLKAQSLPDSCKYSRAWYDVSVLQDYPLLKTLPKGISIIADTALKPVNFVSQNEEFKRIFVSGQYSNRLRYEEIKQAFLQNGYSEVDTTESYIQANFREAEKIHSQNNSKNFIVSIVNNSPDTILFPAQDGSIMAIREAKNKKGKWHPIEYWGFSGCGVSYIDVRIPPGQSVQFPANRSNGDFKTKVRFKIVGKNGFIYSNEFSDTVPSCLFKNPVLKGGSYHDNFFTKFFKIDTMKHIGEGNIYHPF